MKYKNMLGLMLVSLILSGVSFSGEVYKIDKAHSRVGFSVKHMVISTVRGEFSEYDASIIYDENDVTKSTLEGTIKVASINTNNERRDGHLKGADFFDAENYPEIKFKSSGIKKNGDQYIMHGNLTIRGITKHVDFPFKVVGTVTDPMGNKRIGIEAEMTINRKDFGVSWHKTLDNGGLVFSDDVKIELFFEGIQVKQQAAESK